MALSPQRIRAGGKTHFPWERAAIDFVYKELPDTDPHQTWALHELLDTGTGRLYELDLLVLARSALFLVEIKSHPGVLTGDNHDWVFTDAQGIRRHLENPLRGAAHKARVLSGLLQRQMPRQRPWVQELAFLSDEDLEVQLSGVHDDRIVTRETVRKTLVHGLRSAPPRGIVNRPVMKEVIRALKRMGLRPSEASRRVAGFRLGQVVDLGEGYQENLAVNEAVATDEARVRSYLVPKATSIERQQRLQRAAKREAAVLARLGAHPRILGYRSYIQDGPLGPAVLFESFKDGLPLHVFMKVEAGLSFDDRLEILSQVVQAVDHCHRADVLHRNLSPSAVMVRRNGAGDVEVRLHRFCTASQADHATFGTQHLQGLSNERERLYMAPEVLVDPTKADTSSDIFSLGCLAYFLFTGQQPAPDLASRRKTILEHGGLRVAAIDGDLAVLDAPIAAATAQYGAERPADALRWFEEDLVEELTRPDPVASVDPLEAERGTVLGTNLKVVRVLGSGATAKVLEVIRDRKTFALKVPHDPSCEARLLEEAAVLRGLDHPHIVGLRESLDLGGRCCLLLDYAGTQSLDAVLRAEGTLSLEKARRWGEDLLRAIQHLADQGVTHRDIKPGNIGFTTLSKKAEQLVLLDFSLSPGDPGAVGAGTPQWRDPWLHIRGTWDEAADRFAAAAVLYTMLAGVRPQFIDNGPDRGTIRVESERFDAGVRDRLRTFFTRCFREGVDQRFPSAEEMRVQWVGLFAAGTEETDQSPPAADVWSSATLTTRIDGLPFTTRARNSLDRAGVLTVGDLLQLPRNLLSAIRGVGHKVAREIVEAAERLRERLTAPQPERLFPGFPGPRLPLDDPDLALEATDLSRLGDAGLTSTLDLAASPVERLHRLLGTATTAAVGARLRDMAGELSDAGTLEAWERAFLDRRPDRKKRTVAERRIRQLAELDPLPEGATSAEPGHLLTYQGLAAALDVDTSLVHSSLQQMREQWATAQELVAFSEVIAGLVEDVGPVAPFDETAAELAGRRVAGEPTQGDVQRARALLRVAAEMRPTLVHWRQLGDRAWCAIDRDALDALTLLADEADGLADAEPLPSNDVVKRQLQAHAADTPLAGLSTEALIALAARASSTAAVSARLELYPRRLAPERVVKLSTSVLAEPGLKPDVVQKRIAARYPAARPLPDRPALDDLLVSVNLFWDAQLGEYTRRAGAATSSSTVRDATRLGSASPAQRRRRDPAALEARAFDDALARGVERGRFRVVQVPAVRADQATRLLSQRLGVEPVSIDHRIWDAVQRAAAKHGVDPDNIVKTDRQGPGSADWGRLAELVRRAAEAELDAILAAREEPQLLVQPGVLARFGLSDTVNRLSRSAQHDDGAAIVLMVPSHDDGLAPSINNQLPVPTESEGQRLRMPEAWLRNVHAAAAT